MFSHFNPLLASIVALNLLSESLEVTNYLPCDWSHWLTPPWNYPSSWCRNPTASSFPLISCICSLQRGHLFSWSFLHLSVLPSSWQFCVPPSFQPLSSCWGLQVHMSRTPKYTPKYLLTAPTFSTGLLPYFLCSWQFLNFILLKIGLISQLVPTSACLISLNNLFPFVATPSFWPSCLKHP